MARTECRIKATIWRNADFRAMSGAAQRAYFLVLSQPGMNYCGVNSYRPKPWALLAKDTTAAGIERAVRELEQARFVVVDRDTEEVWVRTFIHHDGVLDQPKLIMAMAHDFGTIDSDPIRQGFVEGLAEGYPEGFLKGIADRFPKGWSQGFFQGLPKPFLEALPEGSRATRAGGRSPTPIPQPPYPNLGSDAAAPPPPPSGEAVAVEGDDEGGVGVDRASVLLREFYDRSDPKPAQPWPAMLGVVRKMLTAGWSPDEVGWALRDAPAVSTAALTLSLNRRRSGRNGAGHGRPTGLDAVAEYARQEGLA